MIISGKYKNTYSFKMGIYSSSPISKNKNTDGYYAIPKTDDAIFFYYDNKGTYHFSYGELPG